MKYLALTSLALNAYLAMRPHALYVTSLNANSRPTYWTMHNIAEAQKHATGRGVKIGIIDHYFGFDDHKALYAGGVDFLNDEQAFRKIGEHGLWLTRTAKEIAPNAEIYALNATCPDESRKVPAMVKAIHWAVEHKLAAITYSDRAFTPEYRKQIDAAVEEATKAGVTCVFIHYAHPSNLLPFAMLPSEEDRAPDVNVYHYDYNMLMVRDYEKAQKGEKGTPPYLSLSSTSVVVAATLAMMKEVDGSLSPADCKRILVETSHLYEPTKLTGPEVVHSCPHVLDAAAAVQYVEARARRTPKA
jgi:hypothetical protein